MNTFLFSAAALVISLSAVMYLLAIDEKRRRVFRIAHRAKIPQSTLAGWAGILIPGLALIFLGQISAFLVWFGAVTVCAWLMARKRPRSELAPASNNEKLPL